MKSPMLLRFLAVVTIAFAILIPISLIKGKISERQARADSVVQQFAAETSRSQAIVGPFLAATCAGCPTVFFMPKVYHAAVSMPVESRHRGIYPIRLYRAATQLSGEFEWPAPFDVPGSARKWKHFYLVTAVSDARGIKSVESSGAPLENAAVGERPLARFAIREDLGEYNAHEPESKVSFQYKLDLLGTANLQVAPIGERNDIRIASDWPHPSFTESWTPDERRVGRDGFEAAWKVTSLATGGSATWDQLIATEKLGSARGVGVSLFDPINIYSLSYRATEYAFLFVLFTFGALGLTEVITGVRLHPMQYTLTGSAIAVFFLLLIALSERVPFGDAYASASIACVALLTYYLRHPLGTTSRAAAFFALFAGLYGGLYGLLQSEDNALLLGSLMVFALLAAGMIATRKVDWAATNPKTT
jgi:inner membrane protein